jgi:hypothetical protein
MAPTKTTKKNTSSKSKATQAEGLAPTKTTKKNVSSKSKATQAKGKENAASTAALQAAKKKNQLRKGSGLGMSYHELNDSSTTRTSSFYTQDPALLWPIRTLLLKLEATRPQLPHQQLRRSSN